MREFEFFLKIKLCELSRLNLLYINKNDRFIFLYIEEVNYYHTTNDHSSQIIFFKKVFEKTSQIILNSIFYEVLPPTNVFSPFSPNFKTHHSLGMQGLIF